MSKVDQLRAMRERRFEEKHSEPPPKPIRLKKAKAIVRPAVNKDVNKEAPLINANVEHQAKWRKANTELNRERARNGMRQRRAKKEANTQ
jgi:hypothetical protein